jgi:hypothetical protein
MARIEEALEQIARDNDLTTVAVSVSIHSDDDGNERKHYSATVHWRGFARSGIACQMAHEQNVREALFKAVSQAKADRTPDVTLPGAGEIITLNMAEAA